MAADVLVIGAGIGGLSAAIHLAARGQRVLVLERNPVVGGKMAEVREGGFRWDTGPSVVTMRPVLEDLFAAAGRRLEDYLDLVPVDPLTRYFYPGGASLDICRDLPRTLEGIARFERRDVEGYLAFLADAARLERITAPVFTHGPPPSLASLGRLPLADALRAAPFAMQTLDALIRRRVRSPELRQILGRFATYVGSSPYRASAMLAVIAQVELCAGVWYPRGGVYAIARALEQLASEVGVELRTGVEVTQIACSHDTGSGRRPKLKASGVVLADGTRLPARAVIANLDVATVYERLLPPEQPFRRRLARLERREPSCSGFALLLGVEGQHPALAHHNIFFSADYRREFEQVFRRGLPPDDPTIYVAITSRTDAGHAPPGCENWSVLVNVPAADGRFDWAARREEYAGLVLERLAERGFDLRGRLRVRKVIAPPDLERMNGARRGALYGASFNGPLAVFARPGNRCPEVDGLYFVGGTTHPGGGVPLVVLSGRLVAGMVSGVE